MSDLSAKQITEVLSARRSKKASLRQPQHAGSHGDQVVPQRAASPMRSNDEYRIIHNVATRGRPEERDRLAVS